MLEFTALIDVDRPLDEVFEFIANFENVPRWNYFVTDVTRLSPGPSAIGTRFHQTRRTDRQDFEITALERGQMVEIRTLPASSPSFVTRYEFQVRGDGCRVNNLWKLETGHNGLLERLGRPRVRAAVIENLGKLKELLESGATRLQDGRLSNLRETGRAGWDTHS